MISGVVAQELPPLPRGVFAPVRLFADDDVIYLAVLSSDLDQVLIAHVVIDADDVFSTDAPITLTVGTLLEASQDGEAIFKPLIAGGQLLLPGFVTSPDVFFAPDIRVPGVLQPGFVNDADVIFATPLILDPGMLRQTQTYFDSDLIYGAVINAAQTLFPQRLDSVEIFYAPTIVAGSIGPPFVVSDDAFFNFATQIVFRPELVVDDGRPVLPDTGWDGVNTGVNISSDGLTAALAAPANYCGARSTVLKTSGKFYFEVTLGPTHGFIDAAGILREDQTYTEMSQALTKTQVAVFKNTHVFSGPNSDIYAGGAVISNNLWWTALASSRGDNIGQTGELLEGDVIGIAIDIDNRNAWFRLNGGHWNEDQRGNAVLLNQDPTTGVGGIPVPSGALGPAVCLGGQVGSSLSGFAGDNISANFGIKAYRDSPPDGFDDWVLDSPFGPPYFGDSFGQPSIGIAASLDDGIAFVAMSNGNLTATHNTTNDSAGAMSASNQKTGRYYFEYTIGIRNGRNDGVGLLVTSLLGGNPEGSFGTFANGTACAKVFLFDGAIWSNGANTGKALGACAAGDVIGIAVDLSAQTLTSGGDIWFRKKSGVVIGNWNAVVVSSDADPASGAGELDLYGFGFTKTWAPCVGFAGTGTTVGDTITANFGATPFAMPRPNGFSIWPIAYNDSVQVLSPGTPLGDDAFPVPFIDIANRQLFHPNVPTNDDIIFPTSSFGGNLNLAPGAAFADADVFYAPGNFASLDIAPSPQVTMSNKNLTATQSVATANVGVHSSAQRTAGKYYFEITCTTTHSVVNALGIALETATYVNLCSSGINGTIVLCNTGTIFSNNANSGKSLLAPINGDILGFAIDLDMRKAWVRKNGGLWNNTSGADPALNLSGVTIQALQSFSPVVAFGSAFTGDSYTADFGATPYAFSAPAGFGAWPNVSTTQPSLTASLVTDSDTLPLPRVDPQTLAPVGPVASDDVVYLLSGSGGSPTIAPTTSVSDSETIYAPAVSAQLASFDGVATNVTVSTDKLTATHTNTTTDSGARSTANKSTGKFYFEVTMTNVHGAFDCVGLLSSGGNFANLVTGSVNCLATYKNTGAIYGSNISSGKTLGAIAIGDVIGIAVDLTAHKAWLRKNGGNWNGLALTSENPNTGTGGVTIAAFAFAPAVGFGGTGTAAGDAMTANFGATAFGSAAPTGFNNWTT